ncbi:dihydrouridine synthase (dus) protein [Besnoitia besnoiti]|uniref:tRNA-dihydrouridine(16/17) synthase [NAD(P)(+)] n=1 Tax=Besnoitia besnoiti TaxID=94643 RepID=A0A2A9MF78_BESBE|nr:dihydrouridine synthase (dus) protein [Besnoitia besnoiti]PFH34606.1 dihydrouridine synthase (dus) protein [Besnoitia besnoiti]
MESLSGEDRREDEAENMEEGERRRKKKDRKSTSMSLWESICKPRFVMAPMVDASELAFRVLCHRYGVDLAYTPMMHSRLFIEDPKYRDLHWQTLAGFREGGVDSGEKRDDEEAEVRQRSRGPAQRAEGGDADEPLFVQFCGDSPETLLAAAQLVEDEVDAVDVNFGCPQGIARRGHYGAFLLHESGLITDIVSTLHNNLHTPVTCKMRKVSPRPATESVPRSPLALSLDDERRIQDTLKLCYAVEAAGCACLCLHGRTKEEKASRVGPCDWLAIRLVKERLTIPLIANGGVETYEDALRCLEFTKADAVMSAEGILDNPMIFAPSRFASTSLSFSSSRSGYPLSAYSSFLSHSSLREIVRRSCTRPRFAGSSMSCWEASPCLLDRCLVMLEYLDICERYPPPHFSFIKSHLFRCLHPVLLHHEDLRDALARACELEDYAAIAAEATARVRQALRGEHGGVQQRVDAPRAETSQKQNSGAGDAETGATQEKNTWYWRHRTNHARAIKKEKDEKQEVLIWEATEGSDGSVLSSLFIAD